MVMNNVQMIAHRGASLVEPENTFRAFDRALAEGAQGLELDLHLSTDGTPVVMHDDTIDRTTNGTGQLCDFTAAALTNLDAGKGETIPTLEQLLTRYAGRTRLFLEIKTPDAAIPVATLMQRFIASDAFAPDQLILISFLHDALQQIREQFPTLRLGASYEHAPIDWNMLDQLNADYLVPAHQLVTEETIAAAQARKIALFCWTVDDAATAETLTEMGVDGIISNQLFNAPSPKIAKETAP